MDTVDFNEIANKALKIKCITSLELRITALPFCFDFYQLLLTVKNMNATENISIFKGNLMPHCDKKMNDWSGPHLTTPK